MFEGIPPILALVGAIGVVLLGALIHSIPFLELLRQSRKFE